MTTSMHWMLAPLMALLAAGPVHAARPFMTDDARLTTAQSCQVESWSRHYRDRSENWVLPACNPTGNFEITFGGGDFKTDGMPSTRDQVLQGKALIRPLQTNDWGWGVAFGAVRHPSTQPGPNLLGNHYVYLPLSVSTYDDKLVLHTNLGWLRERQTQRQMTTWGGGAEYWVHPRWMLIAEIFGDDRQRPLAQTGVRWSLLPGLLQIDATWGAQPGRGATQQWMSLGLRYTPDKLF